MREIERERERERERFAIMTSLLFGMKFYTNVKIIYIFLFFPSKREIKGKKILFVTTHLESINKLLNK
jgi:hypothetical protein